jgi:hypothetical protein
MISFSRLKRKYPQPFPTGLVLLQAAAVLLCLQAAAASAAPSRREKPNAHVYLLRGAFNIFSLGMDAMADRLRRPGVMATVDNYLSWPSLADEAAAEYRSGRTRTIIIVGHSSGATAVTEMAARLGQLGVPVKLAIGLDPTSQMTASGHVDLYINYYIANGMGNAVRPGPDFSGAIDNVDMEQDPALNHFNIDKDRALQEQVLREIRAAL